jgi:hypothetical protein
LAGKQRERRPLRRRRSKWEGILKYNLKELSGRSRSLLIWFRQSCVARYYKHSNKHSGNFCNRTHALTSGWAFQTSHCEYILKPPDMNCMEGKLAISGSKTY